MTVRNSIIFCDDIRAEANGKLILIGVYADGLIPAELPAKLPLSIFVRIIGLPQGEHRLQFSLAMEGTEGLKSAIIVQAFPGREQVQLNIIGVPVDIQRPGKLVFTLTGFPNGEAFAEQLEVLPAQAALVVPLVN